MKTTEIVVLPILDGGFAVQVNGEDTGSFANGGVAAIAWARCLLEKNRLLDLIDTFAAMLNSKTPEEARQVDAARLRAWATELRGLAGITKEQS